MSILLSAATFVMRELVKSAVQAVSGPGGEAAAQTVVNFLGRHFTDHSQRLTLAFRNANDRAWRAVEIALQGESWWGRVRGRLQPAEDRAFSQQVQLYLSQVKLAGNTVDPAKVLEQLREARRRKLLDQGSLTPADLARQAGEFARFRDPAAQLQLERRATRAIADALRHEFAHLGAFLAIESQSNESLIAVAVRYFFRRAVEQDEQLARGLAFAQFEQLQAGQEQAFAALDNTLTQLGDRLTAMLDDVLTTVKTTGEAVSRIEDEQARQNEQMRQMYQAVIDLQKKLDLSRTEVRPRDSLSINNEAERQVVKQLVARYRSLPPEQRRQMPKLLDGIGRLEMAAGDFQGAAADFETVAQLVAGDPSAQGEAHYNAYRAALERRDWPGALRLLRLAVGCDAKRFAPFPMDKYGPQRILGAGGFGVAFLCEHSFLKAPVVVKTLADGDFERGIDAVFAEAQTLRRLDHPRIIRIQDCGFGGPDGKSRPYLVMDYFEGTTLEDAARGGALDGDELREILLGVAEGLEAAHKKGVLHRDVKPANALVRKVGRTWEVKLIDFGLAVRHGQGAPATTLAGGSIAGTIDYAAPEQMGKLPGVLPSPRSDVYGFGKTCCYALFETANPLQSHWKSLGPRMSDLLERCLQERPEARPADMSEVLAELASVRAVFKKGARPGAAGTPPPVVVRLPEAPLAILVSPPRPVSREPVVPFAEAVPPLAEAELFLAELNRSFDPRTMNRLGKLLRQLRTDEPGPRLDALIQNTRALAQSVARRHGPLFQPLPDGSARPDPARAAALTWLALLSLWS